MGLKIYISSTYEDLKDFRRRVYDQLRSLRHDVIGMEDYVAADERPLSTCLRDARESDLYVGIFAWRYGYVPKEENPEKKSITELEYLEAKKHGKPCLLFLLDDKVPWPPNLMDSTTEDDAGRRIRALRQTLRERALVGSFETTDELAARVVTALYRWQTEASAARAERPAPVQEAPPVGGPAVARRDSPRMWVPGSRLRVRFLDADAEFGMRLLRLAQIWSAYANITFALSEDEDAEVRVTLRQGQGSWSYKGRGDVLEYFLRVRALRCLRALEPESLGGAFSSQSESVRRNRWGGLV